LSDTHAGGDFLLGEVLGFASLRDAGTQGLKEFLILAVHGGPALDVSKHEGRSP
jgi:hypothetical protein